MWLYSLKSNFRKIQNNNINSIEYFNLLLSDDLIEKRILGKNLQCSWSENWKKDNRHKILGFVQTKLWIIKNNLMKKSNSGLKTYYKYFRIFQNIKILYSEKNSVKISMLFIMKQMKPSKWLLFVR